MLFCETKPQTADPSFHTASLCRDRGLWCRDRGEESELNDVTWELLPNPGL